MSKGLTIYICFGKPAWKLEINMKCVRVVFGYIAFGVVFVDAESTFKSLKDELIKYRKDEYMSNMRKEQGVNKYKWHGEKSEEENVMSKIAQMRTLIWDEFPKHQGEMIGDPFSVLAYYEKYLESQLQTKDALIKGLIEALDKITRLREDLCGEEAERVLNSDAAKEWRKDEK